MHARCLGRMQPARPPPSRASHAIRGYLHLLTRLKLLPQTVPYVMSNLHRLGACKEACRHVQEEVYHPEGR